MQLVEGGQIGLDAPIGRYLPKLVPGERGDAITVRMLINHTSGLAEYLPYVYPSLKAFPVVADTRPQSLDDHRLTRFHAIELIEKAVSAPDFSAPGGTPGLYSNTNYLLFGQLLEQVTGTKAETYITQNVIERAGLRDTELPDGPWFSGPQSQIYEAWFGMIEPPRDFSIFDMSFAALRSRTCPRPPGSRSRVPGLGDRALITLRAGAFILAVLLATAIGPRCPAAFRRR